jgi:hypothetical protein
MSDTIKPDDSDLPANWAQMARAVSVLIKFFRLHIVGLFVRGHVGREYQDYNYTGFLFDHNGCLVWV